MSVDKQNPYQAPEAEINEQNGTNEFLDTPRSVPAGQGFNWLEKALSTIVVPHFGPWLIACAIYTALVVVIDLSGFYPLSLAVQILAPFFTVGALLGCHKIKNGRQVSNIQMFEGFTHSSKLQVILFAVIQIAIGIAILLLIILISNIDFSTLSSYRSFDLEDTEAILALFQQLGSALLLGALLLILFSLFVMFAPALIALSNKSAPNSLILSFKGAIKNILPLFVLFIIILVAGLILMLILGLVLGVFSAVSVHLGMAIGALVGSIIGFPIMTGTIYIAYRDIFYADFE